MATLTDPATELADIAGRLTKGSDNAGGDFLAKEFGVAPWSTEFFKIVSCIFDRADLVQGIVERSGLDDERVDECRNDLATLKRAFSAESLIHAWSTAPNGGLRKIEAGKRLGYLQATVRQEISYPKLTDEEIEELIGLIETYLGEMEANPDELPLVRRAIIDGLTAFAFQLRWMRWMGTAYTLDAFRSVVWTLDRSCVQYSDGPELDPSSALGGLFGIVKSFADKVKTAKGYADVAMWSYGLTKLGGGYVLPLLSSGHVLPISGG